MTRILIGAALGVGALFAFIALSWVFGAIANWLAKRCGEDGARVIGAIALFALLGAAIAWGTGRP